MNIPCFQIEVNLSKDKFPNKYCMIDQEYHVRIEPKEKKGKPTFYRDMEKIINKREIVLNKLASMQDQKQEHLYQQQKILNLNQVQLLVSSIFIILLMIIVMVHSIQITGEH